MQARWNRGLWMWLLLVLTWPGAMALAQGPSPGPGRPPGTTQQAGGEGQKQGIASYSVAELGRLRFVEPLGKDGKSLGQLTLEPLSAGVRTLQYERGALRLVVRWNTNTGQLEVSEQGVGRGRSSLKRDPKGQVSGEPVVEDPARVLQRNRKALELMGATLSDLGVSSRAHPPATDCPGAPAPLMRDAPSNWSPRCYEYDVRGSGVGDTRSGCCNEASLDANYQCSNGYCWGCCYRDSCDAWCALGDYFCMCGVTGYACGPPVYEP